MPTLFAFVYRLTCGALLGAQLFFAAVAAQNAFPRETAALPQGHPARTAAADLVGRMLGALDRTSLAFCALAVLAAVLLARAGVRRALRAAVPPLIVGALAAASSALITPAIQAMRAQGTTNTPAFGRLHGLSSGLLLLEMVLLAVAVGLAPAPATAGERGD